MCSIDWSIVLEFFKLILSWPIVTLIIFVVAMVNFKNPISNWIEKLTNLEYEGRGQKLKIFAQQQTPRAEEIPEIMEKAKAVENAKSNEPIKQYEIPDEIKHLENVNGLIAYAEAHPAETVVELNRAVKRYHFERIFNSIFGSQIQLLEYLSSNPQNWQAVSSVSGFYAAHKQTLSNHSPDLFTYLNYLKQNGLIELVWNQDTQTIRATALTGEFLNYLVESYPSTWNKKSY